MSRKTLLNPERQKRITDALSLGATYEIAAGYAGVHVRSLYGWMARGERETEGVYFQFFQAVQNAQSRSAVQNLGTVLKAAQDGNWQAAAWMLERRHGYTRTPDVVPVNVHIDAEQVSVSALIEELKAPVDELLAIAGPVIDIDED